MNYLSLNLKLILFTIGVTISSTSFALEYYSIFDSQCDTHEGLVVFSDESSLDLLKPDGNIHTFKLSNIRGVLIYNFISSPIKGFKNSPATLSRLKKISTYTKEGEKYFHGFAVQFIENLVVFIDTKGETHVRNLESIYKVRPTKSKVTDTFSFEKKNLQNKGYIQYCEKKNSSLSNKGNKPNRILADKIKLNRFFDDLANGYDGLQSFEEKTYVYARPIIYKQKTRFDIHFSEATEQSSFTGFLGLAPSIQWSTGAPYKSQGFYQIGALYNEYGMDLDPIIGLRGEAKAHFFHAIFVGNLLGLSAGKGIFNKNYELQFYDQPGNSVLEPIQFDTTENYSILMGGDLGPFSLSAGVFYPVYMFQHEDTFREVLSTDAGIIGRFVYTQLKFRLFTTVSIKEEKVDSPKADNLELPFNSPYNNTISKIEFESMAIRLGLDYEVHDDFSFGANALYFKGKYSETSSLGVNKADFSRWGATAYVKKDFGTYIGLGARVNYLQNDLEGSLENKELKNDKSYLGYGGFFSILF